MENLSYKIEVFEGPLDLLLHLISKNKLNIYDINICELLDQYMEQINRYKENNMEIASEFLEMAARLVQIKSYSLLPKYEDETEKLKDDLSGELLEYQVCRTLAQMLSTRTDGFGRFERLPTEPERDYTYRLNHPASTMLDGFMDAVGRGMRRLPPSEKPFEPLVKKRIISVSSRIVFVFRNLWKKGKMKYKDLFSKSSDRSEIVATFLAVLEMIKGRRVEIHGDDEYSADIVLVRNKDDE